LSAVTAFLLIAGNLTAADYKNAKIKGRGERGTIVLEVDDKEVKVTPSMTMKAYDADGNLLKAGPKDPFDLAAAYRILKNGNVVNVKTERGSDRKVEFIREIRLVEGELLQPGKPIIKEGGAAKGEAKTYKNATIKEVDGKHITLTTKDGDEVTLEPALFMRAFRADGQALGTAEKSRIFREGNVVDVKSQPKGKKDTIVEIRLIKGKLATKAK
jgi:hypothetical protein